MSKNKKLSTLIFALATGFSSYANALSNIVSFNFTGAVIYSDPSLNAPVDSLVSGSFSYDLNAPANIVYSAPPTTFSFYNYSSPSALTVNFSGYNIASDDLQYDLYDNQNGNVEDQFTLSAHLAKLDGIDYGRFALVLASSYGVENRNALIGNQPPQTLDLSLFNNTNDYTYGALIRDNAYTLLFSIHSLAPVPETESYLLLLAGLGVIGFTARRKTYS